MPADNKLKSQSILRSFLKHYAVKHVPVYLAGLAALIATTVVMVQIPKAIGALIDALHAAEGPEPVLAWARQIALLAVLLFAFRTLSRVLIFYPGRRVEQSVRQDFFDCLTRLPAPDQRQFTVGDLMSRGVNDVTSIRVMLSMGILHVVNIAFLGAGALHGMWSLSPELTRWLMIPVGAMFLTTAFSVRLVYRYIREAQQRLGQLSEMIRESLGAYELINTYAVRDAVWNRFESANTAYSRTVQIAAAVRSLIFPLMSAFMGLGVVMVLWIGGNQVIDDQLKLGSLVAFMTYLGILVDPVVAIGWVVNSLQRGHSALVRLFDLMRRVPPENPTGVARLWKGNHFKIQRLQYAYEPVGKEPDTETFTLHIDGLELNAGESLGIFGATGCGKTTLAQLISGALLPPRGTVFLDGVDQTTVAPDDWKTAVSYVPQQSYLFSAGIDENVTMARQASTGRLGQALHFASLTGEVAGFPEGFKTKVGEGGISLSGGQRQRVSLARAHYHGGKLFVLDDTTAAVDLLTEARLLENIRQSLKDRLLIISSHRVSTLAFCDRIVILDRGRVADQGTHDELIKRNAFYRGTWEYEKRVEQHQLNADE